MRYEQLTTHLTKPLLPLYWLSGDTPFLLQEASDAIRATATAQGYAERLVFHVENNFDWQQFLNNANTFSLFATRQLLELRIQQSLNDVGKKTLQAYAKNPPTDKILLLTSTKIESQTQKTAWFNAIINHGVFIPVWPITIENLPRWITARAAAKNIKLHPQAVTLLAALGEGNLLAIAQEIEKLKLLYDDAPITADMAMEALSDHARFDIFQLSDAILQGDLHRTLRIVTILQAEGAEPVLVLWTLTRDIRTMLSICDAVNKGSSLDQAMQKQKLWDKQKPLIYKALQRHTVASLKTLLQHASKIDTIIKGVAAGNVWNELQQLSLALAQ